MERHDPVIDTAREAGQVGCRWVGPNRAVNFMKFRFLCFVMLSGAVSAATVHLQLSFPQLELKSGDVLKDAVIRSYNNETDKVVVLSGRSVRSLGIAELPEAVVAKLHERLPPLTAEQKAELEREAAEEARAAKREARKESSEKRKDVVEEAREVRSESRKQTVRKVEKDRISEEALLEKVRSTAQAYVRRKVDYRESSSSIVLTSDYDMGDPEPVTGWTGRFRVTGRAYTREYNSQGGFITGQRDFEVLIQTKEKGSPEVVEFILK